MLRMIEYIVQVWGFYETFILMFEFIFCLCCYKWRKYGIFFFIPTGLAYCIVPRMIDDFHQKFLAIGTIHMGWFIMWIVSLFILCVTFQIRWNESLFIGITAYIFQHLWSGIMLAVCTIGNLGYEDFTSNIVRFVLADAMIIFEILVLAPYVKEREKALTNNLFLSFFSLGANIVINFLYDWGSQNGLMNVLSYVYACICSLLLLMILYGTFSRDEMREDVLLMEKLLHESEVRHQATIENADIIDRKCHDLKHLIRALRFAKEEEKEEMLYEVENAVKSFERLYKTGNDTLDLLLSEKSLECEKYGINFTVLADAAGLEKIKPVDLYAIIANALDNAIEAARKGTESTGKNISMNMIRKENMTSVHIENTCLKEPKYENGKLITIKEDKDKHGYGIKSMQYLVQKYHGMMEVTYADHVFSVDILFIE